MPLSVTLSNGGLLSFLPGLPPNFSGPLLNGALSYFAKTNIADVTIQELAADDYCIRVCTGKFLEKVTASGRILKEGLYSKFMLKNGMRKDIPGIGRMHVRQDQFLSYYTAPVIYKVRFEKNKEFQSIDVFYSPKLLAELIPYFPQLKNLTIATEGLMLGKIAWALPSMKEITMKLFDRDYDEATLQFYVDLKVRELLYEILAITYTQTPNNYSFTPWETAKLIEVKTILEAFIGQKPPSLTWLSKKVALNSFKLKTGFRQQFHSGIFEWLLEQKMQHAKLLLLTTNHPVHSICLMVGYPRSSNFITAFRRRFGITPGSIRRK